MICSIDVFDFLALNGTPPGIGDSCVVIQRPGIDGTAAFKTGQRCKPFVLESEIDCYTPLHASALYTLYRAIIGSTVNLVWNGIAWTDAPVHVIVLDVEPAQPDGIQRLIGGVGGKNWPSCGYLKCKWKLVLATKDP